jgi:protein-tyrosine kinase
MSRIQRAVERADREGLLTWTHPGEESRPASTVVEEPPPVLLHESATSATVPEAPGWDAPAARETPFSPLFVAATEPGSPAAEQYRLLGTRLEARDLGPAGRRAQFLLVTSPRLGDGKTTTSANLALTMSQEFQQKVVLVEADLRRPVLAASFGVPAEPGLVEVLMGAATLEQALVPISGHHLFLLPAGLAGARSTELLASSLMQRVADALRARFTRIVVDTPPALLADTHVLARLADGVLLVVRAGITPRPALERALAAVDRQKLIGLVLNEVDDTSDAYYYSHVPPPAAGE